MEPCIECSRVLITQVLVCVCVCVCVQSVCVCVCVCVCACMCVCDDSENETCINCSLSCFTGLLKLGIRSTFMHIAEQLEKFVQITNI